MEDIVLVGFGGHARSVADCIERMGCYNIVGYTDFQESQPDNGYKYLGKDDKLAEIYAGGVHKAFVTLGQIESANGRKKLYKLLKEIGYELPVIIDPSAIVADNAQIDEGTFIGKRVVINSNAVIGKMCIINTGAICEHDNTIGDFVHIAVGAICCGTVSVGEESFIGTGTTVAHGIQIGNEVVIGAGSTVLHEVAGGEKRYGIV